MNDKTIEDSIFKQKLRCNRCHEIPIIKEMVNGGGSSFFISAECSNKHGVYFCALQDYSNALNQFDKIKCNSCKKVQGKKNDISKIYTFCKNCNQYLCPECLVSQKKVHNSHHTITLDNFDFICKEHNKPYIEFCSKCFTNLCSGCQKAHAKHDKLISLKDNILAEQKINSAYEKVNKQKSQIDEINKILNNFLKIANGQAKEYHDNINTLLTFNHQIFNCYDPQKLNYQSIVNFDKILDIDITDIAWVVEIKELLDKFIKLIKSYSSSLPSEKFQNNPTNIDKDIMNTFQQSIVGKTDNKSTLNVLNDFTDNELLKEIATKNEKIFNAEEIIGELKNIYIMNECNNYAMLANNGLFIYDQETNDLLSYIDTNENFEYDEVNDFSYYYNKKLNKIYLFLGTDTNKVKIYSININNDYSYELIQEIKLKNYKNLFCNDKGDLFILEQSGYSIYTFQENRYEQEKEIIDYENETKKLFITNNYLIIGLKENEKFFFYDKNNFEFLFCIDKVNIDEKSKIFESEQNLIYVSFKNNIQVIDIDSKSISNNYDKINMDYIESVDLINDKELLISCNSNDKLICFILEIDIPNKTFIEKKKIEDLDCKLINKIKNNKLILYTKYGVNIIDI